jgi:hypothetical protein
MQARNSSRSSESLRSSRILLASMASKSVASPSTRLARESLSMPPLTICSRVLLLSVYVSVSFGSFMTATQCLTRFAENMNLALGYGEYEGIPLD